MLQAALTYPFSSEDQMTQIWATRATLTAKVQAQKPNNHQLLEYVEIKTNPSCKWLQPGLQTMSSVFSLNYPRKICSERHLYRNVTSVVVLQPFLVRFAQKPMILMMHCYNVPKPGDDTREIAWHHSSRVIFVQCLAKYTNQHQSWREERCWCWIPNDGYQWWLVWCGRTCYLVPSSFLFRMGAQKHEILQQQMICIWQARMHEMMRSLEGAHLCGERLSVFGPLCMSDPSILKNIHECITDRIRSVCMDGGNSKCDLLGADQVAQECSESMLADRRHMPCTLTWGVRAALSSSAKSGLLRTGL